MITRQVRGNIFTSGCRDIAFGVNAEGENSDGFAGMVAKRYWRQLSSTGPQALGTVLSREAGGYVFHALVCHKIGPGGFNRTPTAITVCLNAIAVPDTEEIGCVLVGAGPMGQASGADVQAILRGIRSSTKRVAVYSLD